MRSHFMQLNILLTGLFFLSAFQTALWAQPTNCGEGATVSLLGGATEINGCSENNTLGVLEFRTSTFYMPYVIAVVDQKNIIRAISTNRKVNFDTLGSGSFRVYGLYYKATLLAEVGMNAFTDSLANYCFGFTDNYVLVNTYRPEGGMISSINQQDPVYLCAADGTDKTIPFRSSSQDPFYRYVLTDEEDIVIRIQEKPRFDLSGLEGIRKVWGFSFLGDLLVKPGDQLTAVALAGDCYELSDNAIVVNSLVPDAGNIQTKDGKNQILSCADLGSDRQLELRTSSTDPQYAYVLTDSENTIIDLFLSAPVQLPPLQQTSARIWGVSYLGKLQIQAGDALFTTVIADGCASISENPIEIDNTQPDGGQILVRGGVTEVYVCSDRQEDRTLRLSTNSPDAQYVFALTDTDGTILEIYDSRTIQLPVSIPFQTQIRGIGYYGNLLIKSGDNIQTAPIADRCSDLSDNTISITTFIPDGGTIAVINNHYPVYLCSNSEAGQELRFRTSSKDAGYQFAVTNSQNQVLQLFSNLHFDFSTFGDGSYRIWGFSSIGNLLLKPGQDITQASIAEGCAALSSNFIQIEKGNPDGGQLSFDDGSTSTFACEDEQTVFNVLVSGQSANPYVYILTGRDDQIVDFYFDPAIDLSAFSANKYRIYGAAYIGEATVPIGEDINTAVLSNGCFDLADNFLSLTIPDLDGGIVTFSDGTSAGLFCEGDPDGAVKTMITTAKRSQNYVYLVTDAMEEVKGVFSSPNIDFSPFQEPELHIYGLGYSGSLLVGIGDQLDSGLVLSSECFELSSNFATLLQQSLEAGTVELDGGGDVLNYCMGQDADNQFTFNIPGLIGPASRLILASDQGEIIAELPGLKLQITPQLPRNFRVYGLAYSGNLTVVPGNFLQDGGLSDACFELTDNFVQVNWSAVAGGRVRLLGGATDTAVCVMDNLPDILEFVARSTEPTADYRFIVTDADDNIILPLFGNSLDFDVALPGESRVYGVSFTGTLTAGAQLNIRQAILSTGCFDLSRNFITIRQEEVDGGTVNLSDGTDRRFICGSGQPDTLIFTSANTKGDNYAYLITDPSNNIVATVEQGNRYIFEGLDVPELRVWGLSYVGQLNAVPGADAASAELADGCFDLSDNFITVFQTEPNAGTLTAAGATDVILCASAENNRLSFQASGQTADAYVYLLTDEQDRLQQFSVVNTINFSGLATGNYRVYGMAYNGNLQLRVGSNILRRALSDNCFDLTDEFVSVELTSSSGGTIQFASDTNSFLSCEQPGGGIEVLIENNAGQDYLLLIADADGRIVQLAEQSPIDISALPAGNYQLQGAAYSGQLTVAVGDLLADTPISAGCFDRSENILEFQVEELEAGIITFIDGSTTRFQCADQQDTPYQFTIQGAISDQYAFLVTDRNNQIVGLTQDTNFFFNLPPEDTLYIRGVAYSGTLATALSGDADTAVLSSACFELTPEAVQVINGGVSAGLISLADGSTEGSICPGEAAGFNFIAPDATGSAFALLVTDEDNELITVSSDLAIDFNTLSEGSYRVYYLSYSGNLTVKAGDNVVTSTLSSGCFARSDNFVAISRQVPNGGAIATLDGRDEVVVCPSNSDSSRLIEFEITDADNGQTAFLLTTTGDTVIQILPAPVIDLDTLTPGEYRIWGLTYNGMLSVVPGVSVISDVSASGCFALTDNALQVVNQDPGGGTIRFADRTGSRICIFGEQTNIRFIVEGHSQLTNYTYLVTTQDDRFLFSSEDTDTIDFNFLFNEDLKVYGLAYTGTLNVQPLESVFAGPLSTDCFSLSENSLVIIRETIDGGMVTTDNGQTETYICPGDGNPDILSFTNDSRSNSNYVYLITTTDNRIFAAIDGNSRNFDNLGPIRELRVWGVAYTGNLTIQTFSDIRATTISDGCFELSENFVTVFRQQPDGGLIDTDLGAGNVEFCLGVGGDTLYLSRSSSSLAGFVYILSGRDSIILSILNESSIDMRSLPRGDYLLRGLSFTGNLLLTEGMFAGRSTMASDNCFEYSDNTINLSRNGEVMQSRLSAFGGDSIFYTCPFDGLGDVIFVNIPQDTVGANYRLVITDENDDILFPDIPINSIPFDQANPGEYRIYGISYTGEYRAQFGANLFTDVLSTDCAQVSDNFIQVISEIPEAGTIATTDDLTQLNLNNSDAVEDLIQFKNVGASNTPYRYFLADNQNRIISILEGDQLNADTLSAGRYRVWGVSHSGTFTPVTGVLLTDAVLADNCFDLSENFIDIRIRSTGALNPVIHQDERPEQEDVQIRLAPNPARSIIQVGFELAEKPVDPVIIAVYNSSGARLVRKEYIPVAGTNLVQLPIEQLKSGYYILRIEGRTFNKQKTFVKTTF